MAEGVGFEPTFLSGENVNGFRFIGNLTFFLLIIDLLSQPPFALLGGVSIIAKVQI